MKKINLLEPKLNSDEEFYLKKALRSNQLTYGEYNRKFEKKIINLVKKNFCITSINGTSALHIALLSLNIKSSENVIVPSLSFIAAANVVKYCNGNLIFIDNADDLNIDLNKLEKFFLKDTYLKKGFSYSKHNNKKIHSIIAVNNYGNTIDIFRLKKLSIKYNFKLIEDASESLGSLYKKSKKKFTYKSPADISCYSFNGNKIITSGGGGAIVTDNKKYYLKAKYLMNQAKNDKDLFIHNDIGFNYSMSNIAAAVGFSQINNLKFFIDKKKKIHNFYKKNLNDLKNFKLFLPSNIKQSNFWLNIIVFNKKFKNKTKLRNAISFFNKKKIETRALWHPCNLQKSFNQSKTYDVKNAKKLFFSSLCIPSGVNLNGSDLNRVKSALIEFDKKCEF